MLIRMYAAFLHLYPADYEATFAAEISGTFAAAAGEARARGWAARSRFILSEFGHLLIGAGMEWIAKWTTSSSLRGRSVQDLRKMRPVGVPRELWFARAGQPSRADRPPC